MAVVKPASMPLSRPSLRWHAHGVEHSGYGDLYSAQAGAYAQAEAVFMAGCGLPSAWADRQHFALLELGFGFGSNFLCVLEHWQRDRQRCATLDYVALEAQPVTVEDLQRYHPGPRHAESLQALCRQWPPLLPGVHVLHFAAARVRLILVLGDAAITLPELEGEFDAAFLDGFAPRVNPVLWSQSLLHALRARMPRGARVATFSAASAPRRQLEALGFAVTRAPGFAGKREQISAELRFGRAPRTPAPVMESVAIVGGGIAAMACAARLSLAGISSVLYRAATPRLQPAAIVHPELWHADDLDRQWHSMAFLALERCLRDHGLEDLVHRVGVHKLELAADAATTVPGLIDKLESGKWDSLTPAWHAPGAGWVIPEQLIAALCAGARPQVNDVAVASIERDDVSGFWQLRHAHGEALGRHQHVIVATGAGVLPETPGSTLPVHRIRGQSEQLAHRASVTTSVRCGAGYLVQLDQEVALLGASFVARSEDLTFSSKEQHALREAFSERHGMPELRQAQSLSLHTGIRASGPDRRPLIGPWPRADAGFTAHGWPKSWPGLWACLGMGSRGYSSAFLAAELLCSALTGTVPPLPKRLRLAVDPGRFLARQRAIPVPRR